MGYGIPDPKTTYKENMESTSQVSNDHIYPQACPHDILIMILYEHKRRGTFKVAYTKTKMMLEYFLSKPLDGDILYNCCYYYLEGYTHYKELQLGVYPIDILQTSKLPSKEENTKQYFYE